MTDTDPVEQKTNRHNEKFPAGIFTELMPGESNFAPLSPISFLRRSADLYPGHTAVIHGETRITYAQFLARARRLASALQKSGVRPGDVVSVMLPNVPAMLDAHFGIPMLGAVLNTINTRLDADTIAYILDHCEAKVFIVDSMFADAAGKALRMIDRKILVIGNDDPAHKGDKERLGSIQYEEFIDGGDPEFIWALPENESSPIALNYTSGTTGRPKGVVYHHRGAYLNTIGNIIGWPLPRKAVYLWTLPMFHCNGWCYPWSVTAVGGTHVCLRAVDPAVIFSMIVENNVTHMCGAPTVLTMLTGAPAQDKRAFARVVDIQTGGAAPPAKVIKAMEENGFRVTHIYGMTELHGISTLCEPQEAWNGMSIEERATQMARQGVGNATLEGHIVGDPATCVPVPRDGKTIGEILVKGNTVMLGYLKDPAATAEAFAGGWMHTGDLAVYHPNGFVEIKDRKKDVIISGGENISSIEVEIALYRHEAVALAAVVARPDEKWGETPCAFVQLKPGVSATEAELIAFCRENIAHFKAPKTVVFGALPVTSTGKIQKYALRERAKKLPA